MDQPYTVTGLTNAIRFLLRDDFGQVHVVGEVATVSFPRSGHWYFSVQDGGATLPCVMFRNDAQRVKGQPRVGEQVVLTGGLDVYPPRGAYQLIARRMQRVGEGDRALKVEALKRKLAAEGLFDQDRKRPLPAVPRCVGVVTSATGAALQDIFKVLLARFPGIPVVVSPCRVQGAQAAPEIARALELIAEHGQASVVIVGRGGGSSEDLYAFDEEVVVRAVAAMPMPVVSAVGHEIDITITDLVADVRAATPSHAAELVVPEKEGLLLALDELDERALQAVHRKIRGHREALARLRLRSPKERLLDTRRRLDEVALRLHQAARSDQRRRQDGLVAQGARLQALSPLRVLERGYAVALHQGRALTDPATVAPGDRVLLRLHKGTVTTEVVGGDPDGS